MNLIMNCRSGVQSPISILILATDGACRGSGRHIQMTNSARWEHLLRSRRYQGVVHALQVALFIFHQHFCVFLSCNYMHAMYVRAIKR